MLDIGGNFKNSAQSKHCPVCDNSETLDSQQHLMVCPALIEDNQVVKDKISYEDLFADNLEKQLEVSLTLQRNLKKRKMILKKKKK